MRTFFAIILTMGLLAASGFAQPTVTAVVNGASFSFPPLQNSSIAQGSFFSIFGTGIGPASSACGANLVNCIWNPTAVSPFPSSANPLPTSILGTSVSVTIGSNAPVAAYLQYVSASQINAVLPSNTPIGTGNLIVTFNGTKSAVPAQPNITVIASSFGTFTRNETGTGPGIITNAVTYQYLTPFATAKPGDYLTIWGTGLGPAPNVATEATAPPSATNLCATASSCPVTVWVGGYPATVTYAGRSGFTAEDQIDFIVPQEAGVQGGCFVQVAVQTPGPVISNFTSVAVDPNGATCKDIDGVNFNDIGSIVQSKGQANIGAVLMLSNYLTLSNIPLVGTVQWDNDEISATFGTFGNSGANTALDTFQGFALAPSVGNCTVLPFEAVPLPPPTDPALGQVTLLDAGANLKVVGPNGSQSVPTNQGYDLVGGYTLCQLVESFGLTETDCPASTNIVMGAPFFVAPTTYAISQFAYTATGTGGANVGALSAPITVSSAAASFKWTNQTSVTANPIPRDAPLTITWSGGDPDGFVDITAVSSTLQSGVPTRNPPSPPGTLAECIAPASAGTFTIPAYVLESLPSNATSKAFVPPGELLVGPASGACSSGPSSGPASTCPAMTTPTGLDVLYIAYHMIQGVNVSWQ